MKRITGSNMVTAGLVACSMALAAAPAVAESEVIISRSIDADRYDPHISTARSTAEVMFMVADTLVALDYDMKTVVPNLAESWSVSDDGLVYTFKLRQGVTFCSGKAFTAADVVASTNRWLAHEKGVTKWRAGPVDELVAVDDLTLEYRLKEPYSELLFQLTQHNNVVVDVETVDKLGEDFGVKGFNGTGPYCFDSWEPRNQLVLTRHEGYNWGPPIYEKTSPQVDRLVWKVVPEESTRVASIQTGQTDVTQYIPYWAVDQSKTMPNLQVSQAEAYFWTAYVGMKITRDNLTDVRVRQAINMAVDQNAISEGVYFGLAEPANSYIAPGVLDFHDGMDLGHFTFDPDGANALLDEAGWAKGEDGFRAKDGKKLDLVAYGFNNTTAGDVLSAFQGDLRKVGINMEIQLFDATVVWGKLATQDFDMYTMSYPYVSAGDALNLYFRSKNMPTPNRMNWDDPDTDKWLEEASAALTDEDRAAILAKVQDKVHEAAVWVPTVHEPLFLAATTKLKPIKAHGIYGCALYKGLGIELAAN